MSYMSFAVLGKRRCLRILLVQNEKNTKCIYPKVAISMGQLMKLEVPHYQTHSEKPISRTAWWHSAGTMNVSTNFIRLSRLLNYLRVNTCESYHVASEITQYKYQTLSNYHQPVRWLRSFVSGSLHWCMTFACAQMDCIDTDSDSCVPLANSCHPSITLDWVGRKTRNNPNPLLYHIARENSH